MTERLTTAPGPATTDPSAQTASEYDRWASTYEQPFMTGRLRLLRELALEELATILPTPPARILDAGGGTGLIARPLAQRGYEVVVCDVSTEMLRVGRDAARPGEKVDYVLADIQDLSTWSDDCFDAVVCEGGTLSFVEDPESAIREMLRVMRTGGEAVVTAQNSLHFMWKGGGINFATRLRNTGSVPPSVHGMPVPSTTAHSPEALSGPAAIYVARFGVSV